MKKSLKTSMQVFGVAGLVFLAGCGADAPVVEPVKEQIEVMEKKAVDTGKEMMKDTKDAGDKAAAGAEDAMKKTTEVMKKEEVMDKDVMKKDDALPAGDGDADGTMDLDVSYTAPSPAGPEKMVVSMTVADGTVTAISTAPTGTNPISKKWQQSFTASVSEAVVGKKLTDIAGLTAIGGASLTTGGFKTAVAAL